LRAVHQELLRHAAADHAGPADAEFLGNGDPRTRQRGNTCRAHAAGSCADDEQVVVVFHGTILAGSNEGARPRVSAFKAFRIHELDGKIVARFDALTLDDLSPGDVVIEVQYSDINYKDALAATGAGKILRRYPLVGGIDLAGVVESSQDARFAPGDAVL